jgi:hypothetical protein
VRTFISGELKNDIVSIELRVDGKTTVLNMPIEADHPVVVQLLREQLQRPIPLMCFTNNSGDTEAYMHPFVYRNLLIGVNQAGSATREEIVLRVKKRVLEHEAKMEKLRRDVTVLEVTAPPKK